MLIFSSKTLLRCQYPVLLYRSAGGVHHESHDEEAVSRAVHAVRRCHPQSALLPEAVSCQTSLPVEGDVDGSHYASQVHTDQ